jgi:nucleoside-diphosphate-sugar epimerase
MDKTVAITGAGGFIGRRLATCLAQLGWRVYAFTSGPKNLAATTGIKVIPCNWTKQGIKKIFRQAPDAALWVHAAARIDFTDQNIFALYYDNAVLAEYLALCLAHRNPESRLIYLSSISVYGHGQEMKTNVEPQPDNHYGLSKLLGERLCSAHLGDRCLVLRLAGVWGKERKPKLFINRCLQHAEAGYTLNIADSGLSMHNYLWVGDIPGIIVSAGLEKWHGIRLVAGPELLSINEMVDAIAAFFHVSVQRKNKIGLQAKQGITVSVQSDLKTTRFYDALNVELGG